MDPFNLQLGVWPFFPRPNIKTSESFRDLFDSKLSMLYAFSEESDPTTVVYKEEVYEPGKHQREEASDRKLLEDFYTPSGDSFTNFCAIVAYIKKLESKMLAGELLEKVSYVTHLNLNNEGDGNRPSFLAINVIVRYGFVEVHTTDLHEKGSYRAPFVHAYEIISVRSEEQIESENNLIEMAKEIAAKRKVVQYEVGKICTVS